MNEATPQTQRPTKTRVRSEPSATSRRDWFEHFKGACIDLEVTLGSPTMQHMLKRTFDHLGRNCHFITVFGRILIGEAEMAAAEKHVDDQIKQVETAISRKCAAMEALIAERCKDAPLARFNNDGRTVCTVIVPTQQKFLAVLEAGNKYLMLVNTLWLNGHLENKEKSKAELELKQLIRGITASSRKMRELLQQKAKAESEGSSPKAAEAAQAVADATRADELIPPTPEEHDEEPAVEAVAA